MVLSISLGLSDLINKDAKKEEQKYALFLGDTVQINEVRSFKKKKLKNKYGCLIQIETFLSSVNQDVCDSLNCSLSSLL